LTYLQAFRSSLPIPQLSDDSAAIWRFRSLFVVLKVPRVILPNEPHGYLGIKVLEVPVPFVQSSTSSIPPVKQGQDPVNEGSSTVMRKLFGHVSSDGGLPVFRRTWGT
jgi:hypothetical protein